MQSSISRPARSSRRAIVVAKTERAKQSWSRVDGEATMAIGEHLVGRADELGAFDDVLAQLEQGEPAAIALLGEPGIGKTRLLGELATRADARGLLVLSGSASELERDLPFWVFVDAIEEYVEGLKQDRFKDLEDDVRAELALVFPSLSVLATGGSVALQHERYRTYRAVRELLELLARKQPLVLVLDDLHWADAASVELLGALLHRLPIAPVLLALAVRPHQMPERLSSSLARAQRIGTLDRFELAALTRGEADELLGDTVDRGESAELFEESGGNPFYLEQLGRMRNRAEHAPAAAPREISLGEVHVPPSVAAALAEELASLSAEARRVAEGAAVAGDPFDPELAAAAAGIQGSAAFDALDELLQLDVVRETVVPRRFRFRHPLVRRAVYETTPGGWRLGAHERSAAALLARGAPAATRAHHVERAARQGDAAAVATLREAGQAAAQRAPASAAHWFSAALRILAEDASAEDRVELLLARSEALAATGQFAESHATLLETMTIVPEDAKALRVRLTVACASVEHLLGRHKKAHARLEAAVAELGEPASADAVALMIELAVNSLYGMDYEAMPGWASRAVETAQPLGDRALTAAAFAVSAAAAALRGATSEAAKHREHAAALIDALPDEELARRLDSLVHLATAELYLDQFEASSRHGERALAVGRATGQGDLFPLIFPMLGTALWVQGRMAESEDVLERAVEAARLLNNTQGLAWNLFNRSDAALAAGDVERALATAEESVNLTKNLDESVVNVAASAALARALFETGHAEDAAELLLASGGGEDLHLIPGSWRARILELLTRCLLQAGRRPAAERAAAAAAACAEAFELPMPTAMAALAAAALALDSGNPTAAAEHALDAAALLEEVGDLFDAAASRMLAGHALAQAGERDRAAAELERAAAAFDSFGSSRYRAQSERELRKLGRHIHRRTRPGSEDGSRVDSLTARELEVARLIVDRKTNPEIADTLFLSQKTVETHIRNMFRKIGVASRG